MTAAPTLVSSVAQGMARTLAGWLRAGRAPSPGADALQLEHVLAIDARRRLCLLRCHGRSLVLLTGGPQDLALWVPGEPPTAAP